MKIGLVLDDTLDTPDGVQQYVLRLGHWLSEHGHDVHYLVGQTTRTDVAHLHSLSRNLRVAFNGNRMSMPLPSGRRKLKALLAAEQFDVLHVQVPYSPLLGGRLVRLAGPRTAVVGTFHVLPYGRFERWGNRLLAVLTWRSARRFDTMIAASQPAADFARRTYGFTVIVIPHPFDYTAFAVPPIKTPGVNVVYMARLVERKGALWLLKAVAELRTRGKLGSGMHVHIGGKGPMRAQLENYVSAHGLQANVTFHGFIAEAEKPSFLAQADVAVFPSVSGESFGISVIEALAATKGVVLAGDNPGYRAAMPIPEQLFRPSDTGAFADLLAWWLERPAARTTAAARQRQIAAGYDQDVVCRQVLELYEQALQSRRRS